MYHQMSTKVESHKHIGKFLSGRVTRKLLVLIKVLQKNPNPKNTQHNPNPYKNEYGKNISKTVLLGLL